MPISDQQRKRLEVIATEKGLDLDELIAEAEKMLASRTAPAGVKPAGDKPPPASTPASATSTSAAPEQPKLFQYHLPFVTVNEVRQKWLGLEAWSDDDGGNENAAAFSAANSAPTPPNGKPVTE